MTRLVSRKFTVSFILVTSLFFLWGYARSVLDVLNKHFQEMLSISLGESALVQGMTYLGYFLMAIPAGIIITKGGYRRGIIAGLVVFGAGALLFIPGESYLSFPIFLGALFLIGCGLAMLETSANPYITEMGKSDTAAGRLNLAQSFNGLGCILGPVTLGAVLFSEEGGHVSLPYTIMGMLVLMIAALFTKVRLPEIRYVKENSANIDTKRNPTPSKVLLSLLKSRRFLFGLFALFFYEVSEISINSLFINYVTTEDWISREMAPAVLSFCGLGLFMVARVIGSGVMSRISARKVLKLCALLSTICSILVVCRIEYASHYAIFGIYFFEAIMFPTIFAMTILEAGNNVKLASSLLMMSPVGGAAGTLIMSSIAESVSFSFAFIVPAIGYLFVLLYSITNKSRSNSSSK